MNYEDCTVLILVEELDENGKWQLLHEYISWRADCVMTALAGVANINPSPPPSPASGMVDLNKIADGIQRVSIRVGPSCNYGKDDETLAWIDQVSKAR